MQAGALPNDPGHPSARAMAHGSMEVRWYVPRDRAAARAARPGRALFHRVGNGGVLPRQRGRPVRRGSARPARRGAGRGRGPATCCSSRPAPRTASATAPPISRCGRCSTARKGASADEVEVGTAAAERPRALDRAVARLPGLLRNRAAAGGLSTTPGPGSWPAKSCTASPRATARRSSASPISCFTPAAGRSPRSATCRTCSPTPPAAARAPPAP